MKTTKKIKFIHQLFFLITFVLSSTNGVLAEPQLFVEKSSNTLVISSSVPESTVYLRIGWPNGYIEEITQVEFVDWRPPVSAPDGQYRFDAYSYQDITQDEMSKQDGERALENNSVQRSGVLTIQDGAIVLDTAIQTTILGEIGPQSRLDPSTVLFNVLEVVLDTVMPAANAADVTVSSASPTVIFQDTTIADTTDWVINANQALGGTGEFIVLDFLGVNDHRVIDIDGNAGSTNNENTLLVDSAGDIFLGDSSVFIDRSANRMGIGTTTPNGSMHIIDVSLPGLILQRVGAPEFSFVADSLQVGIRENSGSLIFEVESGATGNSLVIDQTSNIGMGIDDPGNLLSNAGQPASLHIVKSNGNASVLIEENSAVETDTKVQLEIRNKGTAQLALIDESADGGDWRFQNFKDTFRVTAAGTGVGEMTLERNGNVTFRGTVSANGGSNTFPDYVFEPSYKLMPLNDLQAYIGENQHLPNIPSKQEIESKGNVINMTELQYKLLEKVEELTLYTLNQQKTIEQQQQTAFQQRKALEQQQQLINTLIKRVEKLDAS